METNPRPTNAPASLAGRLQEQRGLDDRLTRLETLVGRTLELVAPMSKKARQWRRGFAASLVTLVAVSMIAAAAITTSTSSLSGAKSDVYTYDETKFTITSQGMDVQPAAASASGNAQGSAIEANTTYGAANTALSAGDWFYKIDVAELAIASLTSGTYKVELFVNGTSKGALYLAQSTSDATAVEGVSFKWSLGASLAGNAAYVVKVTSV